MSEFILAVAVAIAGWWFFTGLVLWLVHTPTRLHRRLLTVSFAVFLLAWVLLPASFDNSAVATDSVLGFTVAIVLWGWLEMAYLMGIITGPYREPCPPGATLRERFRLGLLTSVHHELTVVATGLLLGWLSMGAENQTALWTFATLWFMRWSAKLNLILGVRNYNQEWLPEPLAYVDSYIPRRAMNPLFPVSLVLSTVLTVWLFSMALDHVPSPEAISYALVATLVGLGAAEHVFLMLPIGERRLWHWASPKESTS